jgi:hypothetical protein
MKLMCAEKMIELVAPGATAEALARKNFGVIADRLGEDLTEFYDSVKKGFFQQTEILADGKPAYMIFWHFTDQKSLHVNAAVSLDMTADNFDVLMRAVDMLAARLKANAIGFHTARRGLLLKVEKFGYRVENLQVFKQL